MFGIGMPELIIILVIALIVIGPKNLPEIAKALGRGYGEFQRAFSDMKESVDKAEEEAKDTFTPEKWVEGGEDDKIKKSEDPSDEQTQG